MDINISELIRKERINIDDYIDLNSFKHQAINKLDKVKVNGYIKYNILDEIEINLNVAGIMYINDSITLEEIAYNFEFTIDEKITENDDYYANFFKNNKNILDISEILWENIVLEVPISYTKEPDKKINGDGWQLNGDISSEDNNELAKLKDIFKGGE